MEFIQPQKRGFQLYQADIIVKKVSVNEKI